MKKTLMLTCIVSLLFRTMVAEDAPTFLFLAQENQNASAIPLLQREIVRQAVAMVFREDFGMICRDAVLGEPVPNQNTLQLESLVSQNEGNLLLVLRQPDNTCELWQEHFDNSNYATLLAAAEHEASAELKLQIQNLQSPRKGILPDGVVLKPELLDSASLPDLFDLLRSAHSIHTCNGETPTSYEALIRGYANLGELTSRIWSAAYKVYQARALLYAQRFVRTHPESAQAYFLRAYAFGMCGLHSLAQADLATGRALENRPEPEWVGLLDDLLNFRTESLLRAANGKGQYAYTAWVMALMTWEQTPFRAKVFAAHKELKNTPPVDLRTLFQLNEIGGVSSMHKTTTEGFGQMTHLVGRQLASHSLLPDSIRNELQEDPSTKQSLHDLLNELPTDPVTKQRLQQIINEAPENSAALQRLQDMITSSGISLVMRNARLRAIPGLYSATRHETLTGQDTGEPSLASFGDLLREYMFMVVFWRQNFMDRWWSVDIDEFTRESLPYIAGHRYESLIAARSAKRHQDKNVFLERLKGAQTADLPASAALFFEQPYEGGAFYGSQKGSVLRERFLEGLDETHVDLQVRLKEAKEKKEKAGIAVRLMEVSPKSPYGQMALLANQEAREDESSEFDPQAPLEVLQTAARRYWEDGQYEKAIPLFERVLKQTEEIKDCEKLAECYLRQGNQEKWLEQMEYALTLPDQGLSRSMVRVNIAKNFMLMGQAERAAPYADAAASSYSFWSLTLSAMVDMSLGHKERAQKTIKAADERYGSKWDFQTYLIALIYGFDSSDEWFCDVERKARPFLENPGPVLINKFLVGLYWWRAQKYDLAEKYLSEIAQSKNDLWYDMFVAILLLEKGDLEKCDGMLTDMIDNFETTDKVAQRGRIRDLAVIMKKNLGKETDGPALHQQLLQIKAKKGLKDLYDSVWYFYTGKYLAALGHEAEAVQHFFLGIDAEELYSWTGMGCYFELMERGFDPFARYRGEIPAYPAE